MSRYVAVYDISDGNRRERVSRILLSFGYRVQLSVFEIWLEPDEVRELRRDVGPHLDDDDRFDLFPIDERGTRQTISWQRQLDGFDPVRLL
jgi:CRISPR-associated protein Cas2